MPPQTIDSRVERLEQRVTVLEELPARVDALTLQVSQLREEMHAEFSATKQEFREALGAGLGDLHEEIQEDMQRLHGEMLALHEDANNRARILHEGVIERLDLVQVELRAEIRAGDEESRHHARILHEDVITRLGLIQEGINGRSHRRRPAKKR